MPRLRLQVFYAAQTAPALAGATGALIPVLMPEIGAGAVVADDRPHWLTPLLPSDPDACNRRLYG